MTVLLVTPLFALALLRFAVHDEDKDEDIEVLREAVAPTAQEVMDVASPDQQQVFPMDLADALFFAAAQAGKFHLCYEKHGACKLKEGEWELTPDMLTRLVSLAKLEEPTSLTQDGAPDAVSSAVTHGNAESLKSLLEARADFDTHDEAGCTPTIMAAVKGDHVAVTLLLDARADANKPGVKDFDGLTPTYAAIYHLTEAQKDAGIVKLLLAARADANKATKDHAPPAFMAAAMGDVGTLKLLLDARADANAVFQGSRLIDLASGRHDDLSVLIEAQSGS